MNHVINALIAAGNEAQTFQIEYVPYWGTYAIVTAVVFGVIIVVFNFFMYIDVSSSIEDAVLGSLVIVLVGYFFVVIPAALGQDDGYVSQKVAGLEELGYSLVELDTAQTSFTAQGKNGEYVRGALVEDEPLTINVFELK